MVKKASAGGQAKGRPKTQGEKPAAEAKRYHHGDLKEALLDAALSHMGMTRSLNFTIRDISKMAGVTHAAAYRHFPGKDDILFLLAGRGFKLFTEALRRARLDQDQDPLAALRDQAKAYIHFALHNSTYFQIMFSKELLARKSDCPVDGSEDSFRVMESLVEHLMERGIFKDMPLNDATTTVWASIHGLSALALEGYFEQAIAGGGVDDLVTRLTENIFYGLCKD